VAREILLEWKKGDIHPVYFFYGTESFLMEETVDWMKSQMESDSDDFGKVVVLDLEEVPVQALIQEAETPSFFGGKRLIIGKNASFLTTGKAKGGVAHNMDALVEYLKHPFAENTVLLTVSSSQLDKRKKAVKELLKSARAKEFAPFKGKEVLDWLSQRLQKLKVTADPEAVRELAILVGNDLRLLNQECLKLATYVGAGGRVTREEVHQLVPRTLEQDVFKLTEKLAQRQLDEALRIWNDLLQQKEEPIRILALIIRQFRLMLQVKILERQGMAEKEMASFLHMHPYPVKLASKQGKAFSEKELRGLLSASLQADHEIKSGKADKVLAVERILFSLSRGM